jgi:hypothetical protein
MRKQPTRGKSLLHPTKLAYDARSESRCVRARKTRHSTSQPQRTLAMRSIVNRRTAPQRIGSAVLSGSTTLCTSRRLSATFCKDNRMCQRQSDS